jgi:hypothetical protein
MTQAAMQKNRLLFDGADWDFATLQRIHDACEEIAIGELGLDVYPNQIEVITAEQMLDAYSSTGMPLFYRHWSFGKHFAHHEAFYRRGMRDLAYEIVINSSPCISYLMEENTATMQTLVIAMRPSVITISSRTTISSSSGRMPRAFSTISISPRATSPAAKNVTARPRSNGPSMPPMR